MSKEFEYRQVKVATDEGGGVIYPIRLKEREPSQQLEVLVLPELSRKDRGKELLECTSNLLCQITNGLSKNCKHGSDVTESGLNIEMTHALRELGNLMQYIVNSYSFNSDYVQEFDAHEFANRLDEISSYFFCGCEK